MTEIGESRKTKDVISLLEDRYTLSECSKCDIREEWGILMGDEKCAIGVASCPNCGVHNRVLIADLGGVATKNPYSKMIDVAMEWVPEWAPDYKDISGDWTCTCGETWKSIQEADEHIYTTHPNRPSLSLTQHSRQPWSMLFHK